MDSEMRQITNLSDEIIECLRDEGVHIKSFIQEGGFSNVYKASSKDNQLAVKVINLKDLPKNGEQFLREEIRVVTTVRHKYIVKTHSVIEYKNFVLIMTELADGGDLIDNVFDTPLEEQVIQRWFSQVAQAVQYLHSIGIAHRDIKPDNILIDKGVAKLTDFGYAHKSVDCDDNVILCADECGTLEYLSPEQIRFTFYAQPYDPFPSDCYGLGVLLFFMAELDLPYFPFHSTDTEDTNEYLEILLSRQLEEEWKLKGKHCKNRNITKLLRKTLTSDPRKRMTSSQIVSHPWLK